MFNFGVLLACDSWFYFLLDNQFLMSQFKKLIMMQKLKPKTAGLKHTKIGHVDMGDSQVYAS